jgi:predicted RecB family nuclease
MAFEAAVFERLVAIRPDCVLVDTDLPKEAAIATTVEAMESGVHLILGGWLPDDSSGGRKGKPDLLVLVEGGYLPADVKNHKVIKPAKKAVAVLSPISEPALRWRAPGWTTATSHRSEDGMQLAHYTRMLQACGHHPGDQTLIGAIIGNDEMSLTPGNLDDWVLAWHDLSRPMTYTFSRRGGKAKRSLLERYDHEHGFRVKVARRALQILGNPDDEEPLVTPVGQAECASCPYEEPCAALMGDDDPSTAITIGRLDTREWRALRSMGVSTTLELADLNIDDPQFFADYAAEVAHLSPDNVRSRLGQAVQRAAMIRDGVDLWARGDGPVQVPTATVEIDVDVESDQGSRVYMWGARIRRGTDDATAVYVRDFVMWESVDEAAEHALAERFALWLRGERIAVEADGGTVRVFHWSHPEWSNLKRILGGDSVRDLIGNRDGNGVNPQDEGIFFDLEKFFRQNFVTLRGTGLKKVAPLFNFYWRADDAGGATSQSYLSTVHTSHDPSEVEAAKVWLRSYNEDDNEAMASIRDGIRSRTFTSQS